MEFPEVSNVFSQITAAQFHQKDRDTVPTDIKVEEFSWTFRRGQFQHLDTVTLDVLCSCPKSKETYKYHKRSFSFSREYWKIGFEGLIKHAFKHWKTK